MSLKKIYCNLNLTVYKFYVVVYPVPNIIFLIYIPCSKLEGLKTIPWPAAHTCIVNVWEYPPSPWGIIEA